MLIFEYKNGKTTYVLAKQFGCNRITVSNILKKHGVIVSKCMSQKKLDPEDVISMYENMYNTVEIA